MMSLSKSKIVLSILLTSSMANASGTFKYCFLDKQKADSQMIFFYEFVGGLVKSLVSPSSEESKVDKICTEPGKGIPASILHDGCAMGALESIPQGLESDEVIPEIRSALRQYQGHSPDIQFLVKHQKDKDGVSLWIAAIPVGSKIRGEDIIWLKTSTSCALEPSHFVTALYNDRIRLSKASGAYYPVAAQANAR
jgi:hypothetical protein